MIDQELAANPLLEEPPPEFDQHDDSDPAEPPSDTLHNPALAEIIANNNRHQSGPTVQMSAIPEPSYDPRGDTFGEQLALLNPSKRDRMYLDKLIAAIDPTTGYLDPDPVDVPARDKERLVLLLQTFDPPGVAARDLRECLMIQLIRMGKQRTLAYVIVDQLFELLSERRIPQIAQALRRSTADIQLALRLIARLNPKPLRIEPAVQPAAIEARIHDDGTVEILSDHVPRVRISSAYRALFTSTNKETRTFLREKLKSGRAVVASLRNRQATLELIVTAIAARQSDYIIGGPMYLRPMTMQEIADDVGLHVATVSRAVASKFVATPWGNVELRKLFTAAASGNVSNRSVKDTIARLIAAEDKRNPLKDEDIADILAKQGAPIVRRTVTKYRTELGLPSHQQRKEY